MTHGEPRRRLCWLADWLAVPWGNPCALCCKLPPPGILVCIRSHHPMLTPPLVCLAAVHCFRILQDQHQSQLVRAHSVRLSVLILLLVVGRTAVVFGGALLDWIGLYRRQSPFFALVSSTEYSWMLLTLRCSTPQSCSAPCSFFIFNTSSSRSLPPPLLSPLPSPHLLPSLFPSYSGAVSRLIFTTKPTGVITNGNLSVILSASLANFAAKTLLVASAAPAVHALTLCCVPR